jgi:hypothetical protein
MARGVQSRSERPAGGLFDGDEPVAEQATDPGNYTKMPPEPTGGYPFDGRPVLITHDGETWVTAIWRTTRAFKDGRFQDTGFWSIYNGGGQRVRLHPGKDYKAIGYKPYVEPPLWSPPEKKAG